jgi:hypothetical protein
LPDYKQSIGVGVGGILIGACAFLFNYYLAPLSLPGYELLVAPAMLLLSFFSEETAFKAKMVLFLAGQFAGYFMLGYGYFKFRNKLRCNLSATSLDN